MEEICENPVKKEEQAIFETNLRKLAKSVGQVSGKIIPSIYNQRNMIGSNFA